MPPQHYEKGDFILWNPRERPTDFLPTKLSPTFEGPFEVLQHRKNDILCRHVVLQTDKTVHMDRVKPFFGSADEAYDIAKRDRDQFLILRINYFTGNPRLRTSLIFNITFENETCDRGYNQDLATNSQFQHFIHGDPVLFPLRFPSLQASAEIRAISKAPITSVTVNDFCYLHLRYFDGSDRAWFDSLSLPSKSSTYVLDVTVSNWKNRTRNRLCVHCALLNLTFILNGYEVFAFLILISSIPDDARANYIIVDQDLLVLYPALRSLLD
jgi:hypothetical protein